MRIYLFAFFALFCGFIYAQDNVVDEVIWVVGDDPILRSEVEFQRLQAQHEGVKFDGDPYCVIPEQLAIQKLFLHQADLDSISVSDEEVISNVDLRINGFISQLGSKEKVEEYFGKSISKIREMQRTFVREHNIINKVRKEIIGNIEVTPSDVRRYYESLPKDSIPTIEADVEAEIITIDPKIDDAEVKRIKNKLHEFTTRVNNGESFAMLARLYSEDKGSAMAGGELGFTGRGMLVPEFAKVAFSLNDPKKVSRIVKTEYGYHIIQLIEKRGDRINCRHILLKPEVSATSMNNALMRLDSIADIIREGKMSFDKAAMYFSYDKDTRNNGGLMVNTKDGSSHFKIDELPPDVAKRIYSMNIGEISKAFRMTTSSGRETYAIVKLKSKTKAHKVNMTDDFQLLVSMVQEKKSNDIINKWIKEKQKTTYIRISDNWKNCHFKYPGWVKK